jgi:hypothetical protein
MKLNVVFLFVYFNRQLKCQTNKRSIVINLYCSPVHCLQPNLNTQPQNAEYCFLDIYIISQGIFLYVSIHKGQSSGNQTKSVTVFDPFTLCQLCVKVAKLLFVLLLQLGSLVMIHFASKHLGIFSVII